MLTELTTFADDWPRLGLVLHFLLHNNLLKVGALVALLWMVLLGPDGRLGPRAVAALRVVAGLCLAMLAARGLQNWGPARPRPRVALEGAVEFPPLRTPFGLEEWSSFPSDHAVFTFALATAVWLLSRRLGLAAFGWAAVVACLPRLWFGFHYLSDLVAGAALGGLVMLAAWRLPLPVALPRLVVRVEARAPPLFLAALFLASFEAAMMFETTRRAARLAQEALLP